jgi:hypothetical protein
MRNERSRRLERAAVAAAERAEQARARIEEIEKRLRALHTAQLTDAVSEEQINLAIRAAASARVHSAESVNRARRAHEEAVQLHGAAARAHDAAADALDRITAAGIGDVAAHVRMSKEHRQQAAADRAAADLERTRLRDEYPDRA